MSKCIFRSSLAAGFLCLFSVGNVYAWTISQNYDSLSVGDSCGWGSSKSTVVTTQGASGTKSCKNYVNAGTDGFGTWGGIINFPSNLSNGDEIWVRIRTFMPVGFNYDSTSGGNKLKFLRVKTTTSTGAHIGYNDWYINPKGGSTPFNFIYEGNYNQGTYGWNSVGTTNDAIVPGQWETYEYYIKFGTVRADKGGIARMRAWKNGILLEDIADLATLADTTDLAKSLYIFTYWNGGAPQSQEMYIDDLIVTTDIPSYKDTYGNPFIGVGNFTAVASPSPPTNIR